MLEERQRRIGENEAIFRDVNEMVRRLDPGPMTILCECGDAGCRDQLVIWPDEYQRVRADSTLFIVRPQQQAEEVEEVVSKHLEYWIVRKRSGLPAEIARRPEEAH